jgi:hypothetical protein
LNINDIDILLNAIRLKEGNDGRFFLETLEGVEADFLIDGYVKNIVVCPAQEKFKYAVNMALHIY